MIETPSSIGLYTQWTLQVLVIISFLHKFYLSKGSKKRAEFKAQNRMLQYPSVCIQLPIYNEPCHVEGLLRSVCQLNWPNHKLEIQLLDDSNPELQVQNKKLLQRLEEEFRNKNLRHIYRKTRSGFKAGALNHGLSQTECEYLAIFDADFRPSKDFLTKTIPLFDEEPKIACVQTPWDYYNAEKNKLTELQSLFLNSHFFIEQKGRYNRGLLFNFNGTAGVWKRSSIECLGGWKDHSVTEDLYLSYIAWLKGMKIKFASHVLSPSELPESFASFLVQQRRWAKGNGQTLKLLWPHFRKSKSISTIQKLDFVWHCLGYALSSLVFLGFTLTPVWIYLFAPWYQKLSLSALRVVDTSLWVGVFLGFFVYFMGTPSRSISGKALKRFLVSFRLLCLSPLISMLVTPSFWVGLTRPTSKHLFFAKTPKRRLSKSQLSKKDRFIVSLYFINLSLCLVIAVTEALWIPSIFFTSQLVVATTTLQDSKPTNWFRRKLKSHLVSGSPNPAEYRF